MNKAVDFRTADVDISRLEIFFNKAVCGFFGYCADCAGSENVSLAEYFLGKLMRHRLIISRKVKVNIRLFASAEAEEGFKRNIVAVADIIFTAFGAFFRRKVKSARNFALFYKFKVLSLRASVVRRK